MPHCKLRRPGAAELSRLLTAYVLGLSRCRAPLQQCPLTRDGSLDCFKAQTKQCWRGIMQLQRP
eukprot:633187-Lingulodinium_polyedra.AAC.1